MRDTAGRPEGTLRAGSEELLACFDPPAVRTYVDTATYGLPPRATVEALDQAVDSWRAGTADWVTDWDRAGEESRALAAPLLGAPAGEVALLPTVSAGVGPLAASLTDEDEVVVADDEFRSLLLPLLVAERARGTRIRRVPFAALADSVSPSTTWVATSHVRSNGGGVQDLDAVAEAADRAGARVVVDATHSAGILPIESSARGLDVVVCAAYKHLLCPRGVAFMRVATELWESLEPFNAGWRSAAEPYAGYYGGTLDDLAADAARFDISLAWFAWVGARESLRLLNAVPARDRAEWPLALASALADRWGVPATGSSIQGVPVTEPVERVRERLRAAGIAAAMPQGAVRLSFHLYNRPDDVEHVAEVLDPVIDRDRV